jgi:hypothetical protein
LPGEYLAADRFCGSKDDNAMPDQSEENNHEMPARDDSSESLPCVVPQGMTLENIIDLTQELEHLHELIMLHLDKAGGFTCTESYFSTVQPVLDLLEVEIKIRYRPDMTLQDLKLLVQDWVDKEIAECKKR